MKEEGLCKVDDPDFGKKLTSREPDALIDERLFCHEVHWMLCGNREVPYRKGWQDFGMPFSVPYYHTDIKDAWEIVEELRGRGITLSVSSIAPFDPKARYCQPFNHDEKYQVQRWNKDNQRYDPAVHGKTASEAICKAAFQILGISK